MSLGPVHQVEIPDGPLTPWKGESLALERSETRSFHLREDHRLGHRVHCIPFDEVSLSTTTYVGLVLLLHYSIQMTRETGEALAMQSARRGLGRFQPWKDYALEQTSWLRALSEEACLAAPMRIWAVAQDWQQDWQ